jgi:raffinose/stachyose/melibiose transport system substrate-binding protein
MNAEEMGPWFDASLYSTVCEEYLQQISDITNGDVTSEDAMAKIQATALEAQSLVG